MNRACTSLYLVRHGEVDESWHGRIYGSLDVPLSARGEQEALRVAQCFASTPLAAVVSSGLRRTEHAAAALRRGRSLARLDDRDLREIERGAWAGATPSEVEARWPGAWDSWFRKPSSARPEGGESLEDLRARVLPRVMQWGRTHPSRALAVVTHGWVIRVLVCTALGASLDAAPRIDVRTGDVVHLRCDAGDEVLELHGFAVDPLGSPGP